MIGIIDYGVGNVNAFSNVYKKLNMPALIVNNVDDLRQVTKLILPGVGAFDHAMQSFNASGLKEYVEHLVLQKGMPVLGICVGMQMLAESSEEGELPGLGWIKGIVKKFNLSNIDEVLPLPHMGWNCVVQTQENQLFNDLPQNANFYFLHSYCFNCTDTENCLAVSEYGEQFSCVVHKDNIFGIQCHPEKSHQNGITFLKNFGEL